MTKLIEFILGVTLFPIIRYIRLQTRPQPVTIAECLALRTPFTVNQIDQLWRDVGSWDVVIAAAGYAQLNGLDNLPRALKAMADQYRVQGTFSEGGLDAQWLYEIFGKGIA